MQRFPSQRESVNDEQKQHWEADLHEPIFVQKRLLLGMIRCTRRIIRLYNRGSKPGNRSKLQS